MEQPYENKYSVIQRRHGCFEMQISQHQHIDALPYNIRGSSISCDGHRMLTMHEANVDVHP